MKIPQTKQYSIYKKMVLQDERSKKLNFNSDGREHYVYRITDLKRTEKEHYYGSRTPPKANINIEKDFWNYRTSSNYNIISKENKEIYKLKIIRVFDNTADKIIYESFLHQYFNVRSHNSFWNKNNQTAFNFDCTGMGFETKWFLERTSKMTETKNSTEWKDSVGILCAQKISLSVKELWKDEKYRLKQSISHKGKCTGLNHSTFKPVGIFDDKGRQLFSVLYDIKNTLNLLGLPGSSFQISLYRNTKLCKSTRASDISKYLKKDILKFKGWYARHLNLV